MTEAFVFERSSLSEQMFGWQLEVLDEKDDWCFVRQEDGYLGWVYLPYMRAGAPVPPTHVAMTPVVQLRAEPRADALPVGRLLGGVSVAVLSVEGRLGDGGLRSPRLGAACRPACLFRLTS